MPKKNHNRSLTDASNDNTQPVVHDLYPPPTLPTPTYHWVLCHLENQTFTTFQNPGDAKASIRSLNNDDLTWLRTSSSPPTYTCYLTPIDPDPTAPDPWGLRPSLNNPPFTAAIYTLHREEDPPTP